VNAPKTVGHVSRAQAWVALVAGVFIVVLMSGTWFFVAKVVAENQIASHNPDDARFLGQVFTAFALILVTGFLGIANAIGQLRTGRRNRILTIAMFVMFLAALGTVVFSLNGRHS
jgi:amino acid transporter